MRKKFAQRLKVSGKTSGQGSGLPDGRQTQKVVMVVIAADVDVRTPGAVFADADAVTVRAATGRANVGVLEQMFACLQEVANNRVDHHLSLRRFLVLREERLLFIPRPVRRVGDRDLANQPPTDLPLVLHVRLFVAPGFVVQVDELGLDLAANVDERHREHGDKNVRVLAGLQHFLGERNLGEIG